MDKLITFLVAALVVGSTVAAATVASVRKQDARTPAGIRSPSAVFGERLTDPAALAGLLRTDGPATPRPSQRGGKDATSLASGSAGMVAVARSGSDIAGGFQAVRERVRSARASRARIAPAQRADLAAIEASISGASGIRYRYDASRGGLRDLYLPSAAGDRRDSASAGHSARATRDPERDARSFLREHGALFRIDDQARELVSDRSWRDSSGRDHTVFQLMHDGVPVFGHQLRVHTSPTGAIEYLQARPLSAAVLPAADLMMDAQGAEAMLATRMPFARLEAVGPRYLETPQGYRLTWMFDAEQALDQRWWVFVDARTGAEVQRIDRIQHAVVTASGLDYFGVNRSFSAWQEGVGQYYSVDPSVPRADPPYNPVGGGVRTAGDLAILDIHNTEISALMTYSFSSALNSGWDPVAVSAMVNSRKVYDFYSNGFGRDSLDDNGMSMLAVIHFSSGYDNAFWNGQLMVYGDGQTYFRPLGTCDDVAGHEMTHGVVEHTAGLIYQFQSGALNESMADVMGSLIDGGDWSLGEDCTRVAPGFLRDMEDPHRGLGGGQPAHMDEYENLPISTDNGGVHINSGIPNRAAYLIAEGLTDEGLGTSVGRTVTAALYYRALTTYLTPYSDFDDMRTAVEQAALDLYAGTPSVLAAVQAGFAAVGIGSGGGGGGSPGPYIPTPTDPVDGGDAVAYLYPSDGTYDSSAEGFLVYQQFLPDPFPGYDSGLDIGPKNTLQYASWTRPAVVTAAEGTYVFYVGVDNNLYVVDPRGFDTQLTSSGVVYSIALSPSGSRFVYTSVFADDDEIHYINLDDSTSADFPLRNIDYQEGATGLSTIVYADSLAFDYQGSKVTFDALNCLDQGTALCADGDGIRYWSIGVLDIESGQQFYPFPRQDPILDVGFPTFAANTEAVIAFDIIDYTDLDSLGTVDSYTAVADLIALSVTDSLFRGSFSTFGPEIWGTPGIWGGDDYLTIQYPDAGRGGVSVGRVTMAGDLTLGGSLTWMNDYAAGLPVMTRLAVRELDGSLTLSRSSIDFGELDAGDSASINFTLTNNGNFDVQILETSITGSAFSQDLYPGLLPRGEAVQVQVAVSAPLSDGALTGTLRIDSDGTPATLTLPVSAIVGQAGSLGMSTSSTSVSESAGQVQVIVRRTGGDVGAVSVHYTTAAGTATAGSDYQARSGTLNWADGDSANKTITITLNGDSVDEPNETFQVQLSAVTGGAALGSSITTITLLDDDTAGGGGGGGSSGGGGGGGSPASLLLLLMLAGLRRLRIRDSVGMAESR